ncbi:MAG: hypothetical protein LH619_12970 [Chitinophagaceae bacterium]|nr:hypothetical protein [Chitinophagaceae bacterium]
MKTLVTLKQNLLKSTLVLLVSVLSLVANARSSSKGISPVKLAAFTASVNNTNNNKVDLKWSTETETNLNYIMVEKSTDGVIFKDAALVFTYGNTTAKSDYSFADNISKIKSTAVYYRLRSVGVDGTSQYSETLTVTISK